MYIGVAGDKAPSDSSLSHTLLSTAGRGNILLALVGSSVADERWCTPKNR